MRYIKSKIASPETREFWLVTLFFPMSVMSSLKTLLGSLLQRSGRLALTHFTNSMRSSPNPFLISYQYLVSEMVPVAFVCFRFFIDFDHMLKILSYILRVFTFHYIQQYYLNLNFFKFAYVNVFPLLILQKKIFISI